MSENPEFESPEDEIMSLIVLASANARAAAERERVRRGQLYSEFLATEKHDPMVIQAENEQKQWVGILQTKLAEVMTPGTVIYFREQLYVVSLSSDSAVEAFPVRNPPSKRKYPERLTTLSEIKLSSYDKVEDPALQKAAGKLITKIRLKDW